MSHPAQEGVEAQRCIPEWKVASQEAEGWSKLSYFAFVPLQLLMAVTCTLLASIEVAKALNCCVEVMFRPFMSRPEMVSKFHCSHLEVASYWEIWYRDLYVAQNIISMRYMIFTKEELEQSQSPRFAELLNCSSHAGPSRSLMIMIRDRGYVYILGTIQHGDKSP